MGEEPGDITNSSFKQFNTNNHNSAQNLRDLLNHAHDSNNVKFIEWMRGKKVTEKYIKDLNGVLSNTLKLNFSNVLELRDALQKFI